MTTPAGPVGRGTVHVVGLNPALDRLQVVAELVPGSVHRAEQVVTRAGGKAMIVARGVRRLGGASALHGVVGGAAGEVIRAECRELGITDHHVEVPGETRTTTVIVERVSGASTVVNEPGAGVAEGDVEAVTAGLLRAVAPGDLVVITGSLPPGAPHDTYAHLVTAVAGLSVTTVVDTSGPALAAALRAGPDVVKVNELELRRDAGLPGPEGAKGPEGSGGPDEAGFEALLEAALRAGPRAVIVTRGAHGLSYASAAARVDVSAPSVDVVNATGSGDLMLAGFAAALATGADLVTALRHGAAAGAAGAARLHPDLDGPGEVERLRPHALATDAGHPR